MNKQSKKMSDSHTHTHTHSFVSPHRYGHRLTEPLSQAMLRRILYMSERTSERVSILKYTYALCATFWITLSATDTEYINCATTSTEEAPTDNNKCEHCISERGEKRFSYKSKSTTFASAKEEKSAFDVAYRSQNPYVQMRPQNPSGVRNVNSMPSSLQV